MSRNSRGRTREGREEGGGGDVRNGGSQVGKRRNGVPIVRGGRL